VNWIHLDKDVTQLWDLNEPGNGPSNYIFLKDSVVTVSLLGKF
jgi:hypothetical protein